MSESIKIDFNAAHSCAFEDINESMRCNHALNWTDEFIEELIRDFILHKTADATPDTKIIVVMPYNSHAALISRIMVMLIKMLPNNPILGSAAMDSVEGDIGDPVFYKIN